MHFDGDGCLYLQGKKKKKKKKSARSLAINQALLYIHLINEKNDMKWEVKGLIRLLASISCKSEEAVKPETEGVKWVWFNQMEA